MADEQIDRIRPIEDYIRDATLLPDGAIARWFVLSRVRKMAAAGELKCFGAETINLFLQLVPEEHRLALLVGLVKEWAEQGAEDAMFKTLQDIVGLSRVDSICEPMALATGLGG